MISLSSINYTHRKGAYKDRLADVRFSSRSTCLPPMTGDGDHIAGQGTGPSVGVGAAPVGPNRGVIVSYGISTNCDASGGTPATQAVARIKRGQGADREAPVAAVVNREIGDGVVATRHEAAPQQDVRYFIYIDLVNMRRFIGQQNCRIGRTGKVRIG